MESKVIVVCILATIIGVLSAILGFAAESRRIEGQDISLNIVGDCVYKKKPAYGLGLGSAFLLLLAQILISAFSGCICCKKNRPSGGRFCCAVTCYVISWVMFALAFPLMLSAAILNSSYTASKRNNECFYVSSGYFTGAAVLSLVTVILSIASYLIAASSGGDSKYNAGQQGIVMGNPQMHPPAFVHEDTYQRQQYP